MDACWQRWRKWIEPTKWCKSHFSVMEACQPTKCQRRWIETTQRQQVKRSLIFMFIYTLSIYIHSIGWQNEDPIFCMVAIFLSLNIIIILQFREKIYYIHSIGWQNEDPIMPYFLHGWHFSLFKYNYYFTIQRENILYTSIGWQNEDPIMPYFLHGCHFSFFNNKIICI